MVHQRFLGKEKAGGSSPPVGSKFNSTVSFHPRGLNPPSEMA